VIEQPKHCIWSMDDEEEPPPYQVDPAKMLRDCLHQHILAGTHIPDPLFRDLLRIVQIIEEPGA